MKTLADLIAGFDGDSKALLAVMEKNLSEAKLKVLFSDGENYVPKSRLDNEVSKRKLAEERADNAENTLKDMENQVKDVAKYKDTIKDLETKNDKLAGEKKKLENEQNAIIKANAIKASLAKTKYKAHDEDELINKYIDAEKVSVDDKGGIVGLNDQLDNLYKDKQWLFKEMEGGTGDYGNPGGNKGGEQTKGIGKRLAESKGQEKSFEQQKAEFFG